MKRRFGYLIVALSLLLFAATAALWVRSYWRMDWLVFSEPERRSRIRSYHGRLYFRITPRDVRPAAERGWSHGTVPLKSGDDYEPAAQYRF